MKKAITLLVALMLLPVAGFANSIMPNFDNAPTGWVTDRYQPDNFKDIGPFQGRDNVLEIGISEVDGLTNRPAGQNTSFYNTQGMQYALTGGSGSVLSADLWIPKAWTETGATTVRTDMWGVMKDVTNTVSDYPIIGFTNYGGNARYRVWEDHPEYNTKDNKWESVGSWVDLATPVMTNGWTSFAIEFTGASYEYYINGVNVYSDTAIDGSTKFSATIMQAYNYFGDTSLGAVNAANYEAHWSNTPTPEPGTMILMGVGVLGAVLMRRRSQKNS